MHVLYMFNSFREEYWREYMSYIAFASFVIMCFYCFVHLEVIAIHTYTKLQMDNGVFVKGLIQLMSVVEIEWCVMSAEKACVCMKRRHVFVGWVSFCWYLVFFLLCCCSSFERLNLGHPDGCMLPFFGTSKEVLSRGQRWRIHKGSRTSKDSLATILFIAFSIRINCSKRCVKSISVSQPFVNKLKNLFFLFYFIIQLIN